MACCACRKLQAWQYRTPSRFLLVIAMPRTITARISLTFRLERARLTRLPQGAIIAGLDEAGMGPWAGPVVAAAVILDPKAKLRGLADSKVVPADRRQILYDTIMATATVGVGIAEVERIDRDNILAASHWAMAAAVARLPRLPDLALIDGRYSPAVGCQAEAIVDGDAKVASIAAASIIAKVTRDRMMTELARRHPGYGLDRNMGYGTPEHRKALERLGVADCHRRSFRPVKAMLWATGSS
jgi:ribonuclease HII